VIGYCFGVGVDDGRRALRLDSWAFISRGARDCRGVPGVDFFRIDVWAKTNYEYVSGRLSIYGNCIQNGTASTTARSPTH
jgi:hypothetical protein